MAGRGTGREGSGDRMNKAELEFHFKALVLQGLWAVIMAVLKQDKHCASNFRANLLPYLDHHPQSNKSEEAPAYRREKTFPDIWL